MGKRAFFVLGVEGSGTNMLAEAFVSAGCHYNPEHNSHLNNYEFEKMPDPFVFRRSLPHAGKWPDILRLNMWMQGAGYLVQQVVIVRDWECTYRSVQRRDPQRLATDVRYGTYKAFGLIFEGMLAPTTVITYEAFCLDPEYRRWLFVERFGLKEPTIEINYANPKYYRELAGI